MLLDFLREIERQREQDEISQLANNECTEESKQSTVSMISSTTMTPKMVPQQEVVPDISAAKIATPCQVCNDSGKPHKYKCPKCHILYCGIACYQRHNQGACHESFAERNVKEELKSQRCSVKQRNKMNEILLK